MSKPSEVSVSKVHEVSMRRDVTFSVSTVPLVARVTSGFVPATRRKVFVELQPLVVPNCSFVNLPEAEKGRWGTGLTADDMKKCVWVRPEAVAQIEYLEWSDGDHLRHAKFSGPRDDKDAWGVAKELAGEG